MVKPEYYWKIIEYLDRNNLPATLSLTTNLWAFYKKPDMWIDLFKHPRVGVATSFNYGDTRRITQSQVFTEEIFWDVSNKFLELVGYRPHFISVINEANEDTALDNVRLAKRMGVECKLNYAMASGVQSKPYQLSKIYAIYLQVYKEGLMEWEFNTKQMVQRLRGVHTICPQHRTCDETIRCLQPSGDYYSCGAFGDDRDHAIDFQKEMNSVIKITPLQDDADLAFMKEECLSCPMFAICNGCRKTVKDLKEHNMVQSHCSLMKQIGGEILNLNFLPTNV